MPIHLLLLTMAALLISPAYGEGVKMKDVSQWLQRQATGDFLFDNGFYLLKFARRHGYAGVEVRIPAATGRRLDQYWTPEYTFAPMCRFFDNIAFTGKDVAEIQGYVTMDNTFVEAHATTVDGQPALTQKGYLQNRGDKSQGKVSFEKTLVFYQDHYDATLSVQVPEGARYRYADIWWDINDDWSNRYANSAGDWLRLRNRRADSPSPLGPEAFRSCAELDRGYGIWFAVSGPREEILITTNDEAFKSLPDAGIGFYDGEDEPDQAPDKYESHSCMSLDFIGGRTVPQPFEPTSLTITYSVFFIARSTYDKLYGDYQPR